MLLDCITILVAVTTFLMAIFQRRRTEVLLIGLTASLLIVPAFLSIALMGSPGSAWEWMPLCVPLLCGICYLTVTLRSSNRKVRGAFLGAATIMIAGLFGLNSLLYVEFRDKNGRPVQDEALEIDRDFANRSIHKRPGSDENGVVRLGFRLAPYFRFKNPPVEVSWGWPKKAVVKREIRGSSD